MTVFLRIFFMIVALGACPCVYAGLQGQARIDSLLQVLHSNKYKDDTNRISLLYKLSYEYPYINPDEGIRYGIEALNLATKMGWNEGMANANSSIGSNYENKSEHAKALEYELAALKMYEKIHDKEEQAVMMVNIGIVYRNHNEAENALMNYLSALKIYDEMGDNNGKALVLGNIANIYSDQGKFSKCLLFNDSALRINEATGNRQKIAINLGNIGNAYADSGLITEAMHYYFRGLKIDIELGDKSAIGRDEGNIGETYLEIAKKSRNGNAIAGHNQTDTAIVQGMKANLRKAIDYLKDAVARCIDINRPGYITEYSQSLSEAYDLADDYRNSLKAYKLYITVRDSMSTLTKEKEFARNKLEYEYGKREDRILYQKKLDNQKYIATIAVILLVSLFIFYHFRLQKRSNRVITEEKKRSDDLLLNILPSEVAEELKNKGSTDAKLYDNVTVLFSDFVGFTKTAERLTPQQLVNELHACFKAFDEITEKYNVEKIKTVGDAYLAVCGLPVADAHHAEHMIATAMDIREFMKERRRIMGATSFEIRIGIHSGSVVGGIVGVKKFAYDIWGDTVNTAARMEQNSTPGHINISQATYELVKDRYSCEFRGEIDVKGKGVMKMYYVA